MNLNNDILSIEISNHGAELKSVIKNGTEYMWSADPAYWARTAPVLFPIVGGLRNKTYTLNGSDYTMGQHGFARDNEFELISKTKDSLTYLLKSNEDTRKIYPFDFSLIITYTLIESSLKISWKVINENDSDMYFSIGAHPAFNLRPGTNYFKFDTEKDINYNLIDENGLYDKNNKHILKNDGYIKIEENMFDNDALIIENYQAKEVSLCDNEKNPYVTVKFDMPLFGLWSKKNAPFVCIEPWFGRCDSNEFIGDFSKKDYIIKLSHGEIFETEYEIEFI